MAQPAKMMPPTLGGKNTKKLAPMPPVDYKLNPDEIYYVIERFWDSSARTWATREVLESHDIYCCLSRSRELGPGAKVLRRSDNAALALRSQAPDLTGE